MRLKCLDWREMEIPEMCASGTWLAARSIVGKYEIHVFDVPVHADVAFLECPNEPRMSEHLSVADAKDVAQQDLERRVMRAFE